MIKKITILMGLLLAAIELLAFVTPNFIGLSLGSGQGIMYLYCGAAAVYFGLARGAAAPVRIFCVLFGSLYTLLGLAGLGLGGPLLTIVPGQPGFKMLDHVFHLVLGAAVVAVALSGRMATPIVSAVGNRIDQEPKEFVRIFQHPNQRMETPEGPFSRARAGRMTGGSGRW